MHGTGSGIKLEEDWGFPEPDFGLDVFDQDDIDLIKTGTDYHRNELREKYLRARAQGYRNKDMQAVAKAEAFLDMLEE